MPGVAGVALGVVSEAPGVVVESSEATPGLTKKDWQNWLIGGFISAIASCALNPTQAGEVLRLVKAAFGGLFLH